MIDGYCERLTATFWAEPVNALSNLAFLVAAALAALHLRRTGRRPPPDLVLLVAILTAIGVGSFLFHTLATRWAALADTLPIGVFMLVYLVVFTHRFAGVGRRLAWLAAPAFLAFAAVVAPAARGGPVPGLYLPALLGLAGLTAFLAARRDPAWRTFGLVTSLFVVSLTFRQLDGPLCPSWPLGTHFAWHLCNATVLYLLLRAAIRRYDLRVAAAR
ncbi:ceramidase domain-containing protein [Pseudonocardia eucalypti]|uniref:Ceramidase domain-containing protein n=1 Tax=Pseudonocardia eucalypti TaxID=648755 RepID=A0ABP9R3D3_9PSEU|nr:hypothetical protein [Pseudonocardia eucalypti]